MAGMGEWSRSFGVDQYDYGVAEDKTHHGPTYTTSYRGMHIKTNENELPTILRKTKGHPVRLVILRNSINEQRKIVDQGQNMVSSTLALLFFFSSDFPIVSRAEKRCPVEYRGYFVVPSVCPSVRPSVYPSVLSLEALCWPGSPSQCNLARRP